MSVEGDILITLRAQTGQFNSQLKESGEHIRAIGEQSRIATTQSKELLEAIKQDFGRGSVLKETLEILKGAGSAAAFVEGGKALGDIVNKAIEFRETLQAGNAQAGEMVNTFLQGIPLLAEWSKSGEAIRELLTGEKQAINETDLSSKTLEEKSDAEAAYNRRIYDLHASSAMQHSKDQIEILDKRQPGLADIRNEISTIMQSIATAAAQRDAVKRQADEAYNSALKPALTRADQTGQRAQTAQERLNKMDAGDMKTLAEAMVPFGGLSRKDLEDTLHTASEAAKQVQTQKDSLEKLRHQTSAQADKTFEDRNKHLQQMMEYVGGVKINPMEAVAENRLATTKADYFVPDSLTPGIEKGQIQKTSLDQTTIQNLYNIFAPALQALGVNLPTTATIQ